jgi:hypothetical protein
LGNDQIGALGHHGYKLYQLHHGQTRFPPNGERFSRFWHLGVHADKVVRVHDGVNESVQENSQVNVAVVLQKNKVRELFCWFGPRERTHDKPNDRKMALTLT